MKILPASNKVRHYLQRRSLQDKFNKQLKLLASNTQHPSLHVELLEPRANQVYSFRIDRKYRAIFIYRDDKDAIEIIMVTDHYQ